MHISKAVLMSFSQIRHIYARIINGVYYAKHK